MRLRRSPLRDDRRGDVAVRRAQAYRVALVPIAVAAALLAGSVGVSGVGARGFAAHGERAALQAESCPEPRFNLNASDNGGSWNGTATGVSYVSGNREGVTFSVDSGYEITALCIKTSNGLNVHGDYTISPSSLPIVGHALLTITPTDTTAGSSGIIEVGFTVQPTPPPPQKVVPVFTCVSQPIGGGILAHFGYHNPNATTQEIAVGDENGFKPEPQDRGQPTSFLSGNYDDVFQVPFLPGDDGQMSWTLQGTTVDASTTSTACGPTLRIDKALSPDDDTGTFDLLIDGRPGAKGVGEGGTTGDVTVSAGSHVVSEVGANGTNLADYDTTISCKVGGTEIAGDEGTSLTVTVPAGAAVACLISNTHRGPPTPEPGSVDLSITKQASPNAVTLGETVTWTVTVRNAGPDPATNVRVVDLLGKGLQFVHGSLTPPDVACSGNICTLPGPLAPGAVVTGSFQTVATLIGARANVVAVTSAENDTNLRNNVAADVVYVVAPPKPPAVEPRVDCVEKLAGGGLRAHFGYLNPGSAAVVIQIGSQNEFVPEPADRGQPDQFLPGLTLDAVQVDFSGSLTWKLGTESVTASASSTACSGTLRIDKSLTPTDDPGRFDLRIDGTVQGTGANVTDRGTTGDVAVSAASHVVSEAGAQGTKLDDYDTSIVCRGGGGSGAVVASGTGTTLALVVGQNDSVVCVISNVRKGTPDPPTPIPPIPPGPPSSDLAITKSVTPSTVSVGARVTATVTVTNHGPDPATGVVVTSLAEPGASVVSVTPSQGTCANGACQLGTIPSGGQVTITAVARVTIAGAQIDTVLVRATESDPDPTNNVASALVRVNAFTPPVARPICASIRLTRHAATVGKPFALGARVVDRTGKGINGARVRAHGLGVDVVRRTNRLGLARFRITPRRAGLLAVRGGVRAACTGHVGVVSPAAASISVTG